MSKKENLTALEFYLNDGLDEIICEKAQNHFLLADKKKKNKVEKKNVIEKSLSKDTITPILSTSQALSQLAKKSQTNNSPDSKNLNQDQKFIPLNEIIAAAKKAANAAKNLDELRKAIENFDGCGLKKMATNTVFCDGNADSKIMVIGEAPGNHEDLQAIPFCGDSGKLLDEMFKSISMDRTKFYITNVIFWRPPGNRRPTDEELAICRPFVERHIQLVDPKLIILVGSTSMAAILDIHDPVTGVRGKVIDFAPSFMKRKIKTFVIFHPSYLMRQSSKKKIAWGDMLRIEKELANF